MDSDSVSLLRTDIAGLRNDVNGIRQDIGVLETKADSLEELNERFYQEAL